jgi:hypothetical protein
MRRAPNRVVAVLAAVAALALLALAPGGLPNHVARAADRGLVVVAQTRYEALPEQRRVHATIDAVATSYTPNPVDGLAYYPNVTFDVQPGATHVAATSSGQQLAVALDASHPDFVEVTVTFAQGIFFEQSYAYQVSFDLPDPGGAPDRNLRISPSIVAFPIWAFGSSGEAGGSVSVILPSGFNPSVQGAVFATSTGPGGRIVLSTTSLPDPFNFFAYISADRPGAFRDTLLTVQVGDKAAALKVRAWQDDPDWGTTMSKLMTDGLPALQRLIGLPYPAPGTLVVEEAATSRLGEYAGVYNNLTVSIRIRYDADAYVGLHEAAHVWFNGDLFPDRWIGEAYAEFYGVQAAKSIGASGVAFDLTDALLASKIPLNDWGAIGAVDIGVEEYSYAASYHLALLIFARTDVAGLQAVWRGASNAEMAYQPAHSSATPQKGVDFHVGGWQELLDLLDERTGVTFDDLWTAWVVDDQQQPMLVARSSARKHYAAVVIEAGPWNLPTDLRYAMGSWQFDQAEAEMVLADAVLKARDRIAAQAGGLGLTPPAALQEAFEGTRGLPAAKLEAGLETGALAAISKAGDRIAEKATFLESIGLIGVDPQASLDAARTAFEADQLDTATKDAERALAARIGAEDAGQTRALLSGGGFVVLGGGIFVGVRITRRRRARGASAMAASSAADDALTFPSASPGPESSQPPSWPMDPPA